MNQNKRTRLLLEIRYPEPAKKPELGNPYEEGKILENSPEEEFQRPMLIQTYSEKQLRTIKRRGISKGTNRYTMNKEKRWNSRQQIMGRKSNSGRRW